uniref:Translocation protein SEC62 n=1 Tax=Arion vulgaris TaxID=1028688 RepID=A0A0B6Y0A8_9EUPU
MADKKKGKQRKTEEDKPTKEEYAVAKYLRFNLPVREGKLHGMEVKCFFGNVAVDKLLASKWSATKNKKDPLFTNRNSCVAYLLRLLEMGLFHRAEREPRKRDKDKERPKRKKKEKEGEKEEPAEEELRERKGKKDRKGKRDKEETPADDEAEKKLELVKKVEKKDDKKKKEKRLKLIMPEQQFFEDGDEIYVWIYDPVNAKTFFIGLLMVLGAIALCMFPLWPEEVRIGVYYLSLALAGFVGFILSLVVVRLILFCMIWVLTLGKHHFWLLPNLTEDVGFFDSFRPLYKHDVVNRSSEAKLSDGGKKKKKGEEDKQEAVKKKEKSSDKDDSDEFELIKKEDLDQNGVKDENDFDKNEEDDEGDIDNEDIENDYDDNEAEEDEIDEDEDNNDEELGDGDEKVDEEEDEENISEEQRDKAKKTK